jgi:hypothetical protein
MLAEPGRVTVVPAQVQSRAGLPVLDAERVAPGAEWRAAEFLFQGLERDVLRSDEALTLSL